MAWLGLAWLDGPVAWLGLAWLGLASWARGLARLSSAQLGLAWLKGGWQFGKKFLRRRTWLGLPWLTLARGGPVAWLGLAWFGLVKIFSGAFGATCSIFFSGAFGAKLGSAWLCQHFFPAPPAPHVDFFLWRLRRQTWLGLAWLALARGGPVAWLGFVKIFSGAFGAT